MNTMVGGSMEIDDEGGEGNIILFMSTLGRHGYQPIRDINSQLLVDHFQ